VELLGTTPPFPAKKFVQLVETEVLESVVPCQVITAALDCGTKEFTRFPTAPIATASEAAFINHTALARTRCEFDTILEGEFFIKLFLG